MQQDQLLELRSKIIKSTQELALRGAGTVAERLRILLSSIAQGGADLEVLSRAFELTQELEDDDERLSALLDVLYEVDEKIATTSGAESQPEQEQVDHQQ